MEANLIVLLPKQFGIQGLVLRTQGLGFRDQGLGFRIQGRFRVQNKRFGSLGFRTYGLEFKVEGLEHMVQGLRSGTAKDPRGIWRISGDCKESTAQEDSKTFNVRTSPKTRALRKPDIQWYHGFSFIAGAAVFCSSAGKAPPLSVS